MDEPTTGLDPRSRMQLWELLLDLVKEGTTLLLHDAKKVAGGASGQAGEVLNVDESGMMVAVPGGQIQVTRVRPEGGQKVAAAAFAKTAGLRPGARLGAK
jgi:methionyl-tRNA formyltransferase